MDALQALGLELLVLPRGEAARLLAVKQRLRAGRNLSGEELE